MLNILHHRFHKKEKSPVVRFFDVCIYGIGMFGPLMALPQVYEIWIKRNAAGVSILSWGAFMIMSIIWTIYGILHKEKPLIVYNGLWIVMNGLVAIGAYLYR